MAEVQVPPPLLPNWPILMSTDMAARFLSVDELTFALVAERSNLKPVNLGVPLVRWRRAELERLVAKLETAEHTVTDPRLVAMREADEGLAERIVQTVVSRVAAADRQPPPLMVSVRDAGKLMGVGYTTIYKLIGDGRLPAHRLGGRTLIKRSDVEALFAEGQPKPTGRKGRPSRW